jgi:hypothetical protein
LRITSVLHLSSFFSLAWQPISMQIGPFPDALLPAKASMDISPGYL